MVNTIRTLTHWDGQAQKTQVTIGNVKGKKFPWQQRERLWYLWAWTDENRERLPGFASQSCTFWIGLPLIWSSPMMKPSNLLNLNINISMFMQENVNHILQRLLYVLQTQCNAEAFTIWNPFLQPQSLCSVRNNMNNLNTYRWGDLNVWKHFFNFIYLKLNTDWNALSLSKMNDNSVATQILI